MLNSIGKVKLFIVVLFVMFIGNKVRNVVVEVYMVLDSVVLILLFNILSSGLFGLVWKFLWIWLNIIILLLME